MAKRKHLKFVEKSINSLYRGISVFNGVYDDFKTESTLILLTNAWELLGKGLLLKQKESIYTDKNNNKSLSAEQVIKRLYELNFIERNVADTIQQVVSLRNQAVHNLLPSIPDEIQYHLLFYSCKFFKNLINNNFKSYDNMLSRNFLTISLEYSTTYSDKVSKLISKLRRSNENDKKLVWCLEKGIEYNDIGKYITQLNFENKYKNKKKISPHLRLSDFMQSAEMVRIVPVQAPKGYTVDVQLRKGKNKSDNSLPVMIKKTDVETDYPYLTSDIAKKSNKNQSFVAIMASKLNIKNNDKYHQQIRSSSSGYVQRYSDAALQFIKSYLKENPDYNPWKA